MTHPTYVVDAATYRGRRARCRYCPALMVWGTSATGAAVPLDVASAEQIAPQRWRMVSHWATCPGAKRAAEDRDQRRAAREARRDRRENPPPQAPRSGDLPFDP